MVFSISLLVNAIISGVFLGGFYVAVSLGVTIAFGMLDIVNIAHPAFIMIGAFAAFFLNTRYGVDPLLASIAASVLGFLVGSAVYRFYHAAFEKRGDESLQGLTFFFGLLFIVEVGLQLVFGVDYRFVTAPYIGPTMHIGYVDIPFRLLVPLVVGILMAGGTIFLMSRTYLGRAIHAVSQDPLALRLVGVDPIRVKRIAFGFAIASAIIAGGLLIIIQPVVPSLGRDYIGRVFAITVLGGMTSVPGTLLASMILGISESLTSTFFGPSWSPAVAFGILLLTLAIRPAGILGR